MAWNRQPGGTSRGPWWAVALLHKQQTRRDGTLLWPRVLRRTRRSAHTGRQHQRLRPAQRGQGSFHATGWHHISKPSACRVYETRQLLRGRAPTRSEGVVGVGSSSGMGALQLRAPRENDRSMLWRACHGVPNVTDSVHEFLWRSPLRVRFSAFVVTEISVRSPRYLLLLLSIKTFPGSRYPKWFDFENRSTGALDLVVPPVVNVQYRQLRYRSATNQWMFLSRDIGWITPLFICDIWRVLSGTKYRTDGLFNFENRSTAVSYPISLVFDHQDLVVFLRSVQLKWSVSEMCGTLFRRLNANRIGLATDSGPL